MDRDEFLLELKAYCERDNLVGSLANVSARLMAFLPNINWVGFYLYDGKILRLGPFQGQAACTQIQLGRGVCGQVAQQLTSLIVDDVDQFPGHIVCDPRSKSELVVPIVQSHQLCGVLDVDSAEKSRFNSQDLDFFKRVVEILVDELTFLKERE